MKWCSRSYGRLVHCGHQEYSKTNRNQLCVQKCNSRITSLSENWGYCGWRSHLRYHLFRIQ